MATTKIKGNASGSGSVTITAPNTNSNRTVTLPDADLTIPATNSSGTLTTQGDILYRDGSGIQRLPKGAAGKVLKMNSGATAPEWGDDAGGLYESWAHVYELAASAGDAGGSFTSGAMRTRTLNQEEDPDGIVSLSSNQFTLGAGTYRITWSAPAFKVSQHTTQLYNVTDSAVAARGSMGFSHNGGSTMTESLSVGCARITIGGSKAFEIQHQAGITFNTEGFGNGMGGQIYKFTIVEILKEA